MFISKIRYVSCHSETWAGAVITENKGAFGNDFLAFAGVQVPRMGTSEQLHPLCWALWRRQQWDLHSARLGWASSCSSQAQQSCGAAWRRLHHPGNNATASKLAGWHSRCPAPISFLPCVGHFCPQCGEFKCCPPKVLSVLWGMRCCKPGWAARASQKGGSWQQAALPNVFSQPLIKLWDSFYSCAVLEKLEACMDLHDGRVCPWVYRRGKLLAFLYKEYDQRQLATYFWYSPLQFLRWHLREPTSI